MSVVKDTMLKTKDFISGIGSYVQESTDKLSSLSIMSIYEIPVMTAVMIGITCVVLSYVSLTDETIKNIPSSNTYNSQPQQQTIRGGKKARSHKNTKKRRS
jgi:hypothetical protein